MSSLETSSPVSASTLAYLMRWPVFRLIWLKLIFSESEVAGYKSDRAGNEGKAQKALPVGAGGHSNTPKRNRTRIQDDPASLVPTIKLGCSTSGTQTLKACLVVHFMFLIRNGSWIWT